ncbi:MAG: hypothetical protein HYX99_02665 [Chloroflexi bacterium]|nr:hypothetical protein [Chloroflexota bacterium]
MKPRQLLLTFFLAVTLAVGGLTPALASPSGQLPPGQHRGLFGTVTALGTGSLTVDTGQGPVSVTVDESTKFRLPGRESFSFSDLQVGDRLALLARVQGEALSALMVMVVPSQALNRHRTGAITDIQGITITITDKDGNTLTLEVPGGAAGLALGQVVTSIVRHDPGTGKPVAQALHQIGQVLERLGKDVREAEGKDGNRGRGKDTERLRELLEDNVARHLGILQEVLERVPEQARPHIQEAMEHTRRGHQEALRALNMSGPQIEVVGSIAAIDLAASTVTIQPRLGDPLVLQVTGNSRLHKDNLERAGLSDLAVGDTVLAVRFDPESKEVSRLVAKSPRMEQAEGILSAVNTTQGTVTILPAERRDPLTLTVTASSQITRNGAPAVLAGLAVGDVVEEVEFTEGTLSLTRLVVLSRDQAQGVVVEFSGTIESFTDIQVMVSGQAVTTDAETHFKGQPQVGASARVEALVQVSGGLLALELNVSQRRGPPEPRGAGRTKLMGVVDSSTGTEVMVAGRTVTISNQTEVKGTLEVGVTVKVEGTLQSDGSILASKVEVLQRNQQRQQQKDEKGEFTGTIESLSADRWLISGKQVVIDARTRIEVKGILQVGATAKVEGTLQSDGSILASKIEVRTVRPTPTAGPTPTPTPSQ